MKKYNLLFIGFLMMCSFTKAENYNLDLAKSIELAKEKSLSMQSLIQDLNENWLIISGNMLAGPPLCISPRI